jgi:hypothetical protein
VRLGSLRQNVRAIQLCDDDVRVEGDLTSHRRVERSLRRRCHQDARRYRPTPMTPTKGPAVGSPFLRQRPRPRDAQAQAAPKAGERAARGRVGFVAFDFPMFGADPRPLGSPPSEKSHPFTPYCKRPCGGTSYANIVRRAPVTLLERRRSRLGPPFPRWRQLGASGARQPFFTIEGARAERGPASPGARPRHPPTIRGRATKAAS